MRVFKAEELFHVAEAHFQRPAQSEGFEDLRRLQREVGGEETIVAAVAARVVYEIDDDAGTIDITRIAHRREVYE